MPDKVKAAMHRGMADGRRLKAPVLDTTCSRLRHRP